MSKRFLVALLCLGMILFIFRHHVQQHPWKASVKG